MKVLVADESGMWVLLHRQEEIFGRDGRRLPKQTLCDWTLKSGEALQPIAWIDELLLMNWAKNFAPTTTA